MIIEKNFMKDSNVVIEVCHPDSGINRVRTTRSNCKNVATALEQRGYSILKIGEVYDDASTI